MKIKEIPEFERPREKLIKNGANVMSTSELLAIILEGGTKNINANELAFLLLKEIGSIKNFLNTSYSKLINIKGIGPAKATKIMATIELGKRIILEEEKPHIILKDPRAIYLYSKPLFYLLKQECFYIILLDINHKVLETKLLFKGTMTRSSVHPREIFKEAYLTNASFIICLHNHPSGKVNPSPKDIEFTSYLVALGQIHGVLIYDHLIVSDETYYSFKENNILDNCKKIKEWVYYLRKENDYV